MGGCKLLRVQAMLAIGVLLAASCNVGAEFGDEEYRSHRPATTDPSSQRRLQQELEDARRREQAEARKVEMQQAAEVARRAAEAAARPEGQRLLEARCVRCHSLEVLAGLQRGTVGWRFTVERMRWWHGADLHPGEAPKIVAWLQSGHPAGPARRAAEWALALAVAVGGLVTAWKGVGVLKRWVGSAR